MKKTTLLIYLFLSVSFSQAQEVQKIINLIEEESYEAVFLLATRGLESDILNPELNFYAGLASLHLSLHEDALYYVSGADSSVSDKYYFYLGKAYFENAHYQEAYMALDRQDKSLLSQQELVFVKKSVSYYQALNPDSGSIVVTTL